ncbi:hypothetical protein [Vibrio breoganii]|uniref:hypothetical protein n=1 Tax=Vibrio breoganii TaxID=553239 RepID=UPI0021C464F4|nr:hypothetical protein [Vibrio breoganii]MDN3715305.1 hypothetical protein [Vibrio breoganii]
MKKLAAVLVIASVILTGCQGGSDSHEVQKSIQTGEKAKVSLPSVNELNVQSTNENKQKSPPLPSTSSPTLITHNSAESKKSFDTVAHVHSPKESKQPTSEETTWLEDPDNQKTIEVFQDGGFTEEQVYDLCKTYLTSDATFTCTSSIDKDGNDSANFKFYYRTPYKVNAKVNADNFDGRTEFTYTPIEQKLVILKARQFDSTQDSANDQLNNINKLVFKDVETPKVEVERDVDNATITAQATLYMDDEITKSLRDDYINSQEDSNLLSKLSFYKKSKPVMALTENMDKGNADDVPVMNSCLHKILEVAGR